MDDVRRVQREIGRLKRGMARRRVVRASILTALFSVYGYFPLARALPVLARAIYVAW